MPPCGGTRILRRLAGHADVVVTSGKELKNAETDEQIALKDGRTLPVKFRIEEELVLREPVPATRPDSIPAAVNLLISGDYRRPDDGTGWQTGDWPLRATGCS